MQYRIAKASRKKGGNKIKKQNAKLRSTTISGKSIEQKTLINKLMYRL